MLNFLALSKVLILCCHDNFCRVRLVVQLEVVAEAYVGDSAKNDEIHCELN